MTFMKFITIFTSWKLLQMLVLNNEFQVAPESLLLIWRYIKETQSRESERKRGREGEKERKTKYV